MGSVATVLELLGYRSIEEFRENHPLLIKKLLKEKNLSRETFQKKLISA
ncbi:TPA: hypothetical protein ACTXXA_003731 [Legionella anisa]